LLGAETALRKHADCTIGELRESREGEMKWVGGVVTALNRKYTKRGELMAVFLLEDLESAIEVFVFPKTYQEHGLKLEDDAIVCVKGRLDTREEPAKIVAMEITRPHLALDGGPPLRLRLPVATLSESLVHDVKRLLVEHPGDSPVYLVVGEKVLRLPDEFNVDCTNGLVAELRVLLGEGGVLL
jgi:DNA polymerase-3 subunit alpha